MSVRRNLASLLGVLLAVAACTSTTPVIPEGVDNPHSVAAVCFRKLATEPNTAYVYAAPNRCTNQVCLRSAAEGAPDVEVDLADCSTATGDQLLISNTLLRVLVGGGSKGSISLADPSAGEWVDTDLSIPGWTPFALPGLPGPMALDAEHGVVYVLLPVEHQILSLDVKLLLAGRLKLLAAVDLDFAPAGLVLTQKPEPRLYIADPLGNAAAGTGGGLWQLALAGFGSAKPTFTPLSGTPNTLTVAAATGHVYIGHLREGYVTVFDPAAGKTVQKIAIAPACDDGVDNDGDGLTDRADSGCDSVRDAVEGDPENGAARCADGLDNDGDGQIDAADLGCSAANTRADVCRNGKDDDGDGKTDYPDDPGCAGFGDANEDSDSLPADVTAAAFECEDGIDNDADGRADRDDPDCYNRASLHEVAALDQPRTLIAATFDGRYVVAADRDRRTLHIIDTKTVSAILPQPGSAVPFQHPSRLDQRDGVQGLPLAQLPMSLAPVRYQGRDAMAIGQAAGGAVILQFELAVDSPTQIGLLLNPTANDQPPATSAGMPALIIDGKQVDVGSSISARYASLGRLAVDTDKSKTPVQTSYYGLTPNQQVADHRSEMWRFTFEGALDLLGVAVPSQFQAPGVLVNPRGGFCEMGVLPDDFVLLTAQKDCGPVADGVTARYRIVAVHADSLELDPASGRVDVPVTSANLLTVDTKQITPLALPPTTCKATVRLRAHDWLVAGTRTGILSSRASVDGECAPLADWELAGARMLEPKPAGNGELKLSHCPPYTPPSADVPIQIDAALAPSPFVHPVFSAQLYPGCSDKQVLPSIRDAVWSFAVTAGLQARASAVGAAPVAMASGPTFANLYVVSQGTGALYSVNILSNLVSTPLQ